VTKTFGDWLKKNLLPVILVVAVILGVVLLIVLLPNRQGPEDGGQTPSVSQSAPSTEQTQSSEPTLPTETTAPTGTTEPTDPTLSGDPTDPTTAPTTPSEGDWIDVGSGDQDPDGWYPMIP